MKHLLPILITALLSLPSLASAIDRDRSELRPRAARVAASTCRRKKGKGKGKKRRRGAAARPAPTPTPTPAPAPATPEATPAGDANEGGSILDSGEGDLTGMGDNDPTAAAPAAGTGLRRSNRMEFDARLIKGQKATSGAVYLFQRAPRRLPPLLTMHQSYLEQIVEPVLGKEEKE